MDRLKQLEGLVHNIPSYILLFFISLLAGIVKFVIGGIYSLKQFFIDSLAAALSGFITFSICSYYELDMNLTSAIVGISGYSGVELLKQISVFVKYLFTCF